MFLVLGERHKNLPGRVGEEASPTYSSQVRLIEIRAQRQERARFRPRLSHRCASVAYPDGFFPHPLAE